MAEPLTKSYFLTAPLFFLIAVTTLMAATIFLSWSVAFNFSQREDFMYVQVFKY